MASLFKSASYSTACIGKWNLGFGEHEPDWNGELKPGPLEVGFDYYFGVPTSNNWPPFVYVENHWVVGRRPEERIQLTDTRWRESILANDRYPLPQSFVDSLLLDERLRVDRKKWKELNEIAAQRKDEEIALVQTTKAVEFIRRNHNKLFFLYLATTNIHRPLTPNTKFQAGSQSGIRGDFIHELDWTVGEVLQTLDQLKLKKTRL